MLRLSSISLLFFITILPGCKKSSTPSNAAAVSTFSFTYNGHTYAEQDCGVPIEFGGEVIGVEIRRPDVLGGLVRFIWPNSQIGTCAYIVPTGTDITYLDNSCTYGSSGPIDSSLIYSYSSGDKQNYSVSNCKKKKDLFSGSYYTVCTISGDFSLVLINNAGLTKKITGSFVDGAIIQ